MAKKKAKRLTPNQQEFQKQIKRIKRLTKSLQKEGFLVPDFESPKKTRITKKLLSDLKKINRNNMAKNSDFVIFETGEIVSGEAGIEITKYRKRNKRNTNKKTVNIGSHIYDSVMNDLKNFNGKYRFAFEYRDNLLQFLNALEDEIGKEELIRRMSNADEDLIDLSSQILIDSQAERIEANITAFKVALTGSFSELTELELKADAEQREFFEGGYTVED